MHRIPLWRGRESTAFEEWEEFDEIFIFADQVNFNAQLHPICEKSNNLSATFIIIATLRRQKGV